MKNETDVLNEAIALVQQKRDLELGLLKEQFYITYESLKPINLIKSTFKEVSSSSEMKTNMIGNAIGIGAGVLSKKLWLGKLHNPIKRIIGTLIQFAISKLASKHADGIKSTGKNLLSRYLKHRKESKSNFHDESNTMFI